MFVYISFAEVTIIGCFLLIRKLFSKCIFNFPHYITKLKYFLTEKMYGKGETFYKIVEHFFYSMYT